MMSPGVPVRIMLRDSGTAATTGPARGDAMSGDAMIGFEAGERRLTTRLLAGEFIRYRSRFPEEFGCTAELPAEAFAEAVRRVSLVAERGTPVQLSFSAGRVTVGAATQGQARAKETVPADFTGDEPVIAFSPQYLLDGVVAATAGAVGAPGAPGAPDPDTGGTAHGTSSVPDGTRVTLRFTSASKPAVITRQAGSGAGIDFRYLVVPQRVQL
jgi:DNA polymerase-3 subunit beta